MWHSSDALGKGVPSFSFSTISVGDIFASHKKLEVTSQSVCECGGRVCVEREREYELCVYIKLGFKSLQCMPDNALHIHVHYMCH